MQLVITFTLVTIRYGSPFASLTLLYLIIFVELR